MVKLLPDKGYVAGRGQLSFRLTAEGHSEKAFMVSRKPIPGSDTWLAPKSENESKWKGYEGKASEGCTK